MKKKLRIYLSTDKNVLRKFYWFEAKNDDFYWGVSTDVKHVFCEVHPKTHSSFQINTPSNFKVIKESRSKYSFHEKGEFHIQKLKDGVYGEIKLKENWESQSEFNHVIRIQSLITKPIITYPIERKKPARKNSMGRAILFEGKTVENRLFVDFLISTPVKGKVMLPSVLFDFGPSNTKIEIFPMTNKIWLWMRYVKLGNLQDWHADKELIFLRRNKKQESI